MLQIVNKGNNPIEKLIMVRNKNKKKEKFPINNKEKKQEIETILWMKILTGEKNSLEIPYLYPIN